MISYEISVIMPDSQYLHFEIHKMPRFFCKSANPLIPSLCTKSHLILNFSSMENSDKFNFAALPDVCLKRLYAICDNKAKLSLYNFFEAEKKIEYLEKRNIIQRNAKFSCFLCMNNYLFKEFGCRQYDRRKLGVHLIFRESYPEEENEQLNQG